MTKLSMLAIATLVSFTGRAAAEDAADDKTAAAVKAALAEDRKERDARAEAEARYKKEAIVFTDVYFGNESGVRGRALVPYRNGRKLEVVDFYDAVGRSDLSATYRRRTTYAWISLGTAVALEAASLVVMTKALEDDCEALEPGFDACFAAAEKRQAKGLKLSLGLAGGGIAVMFVGIAFLRYRISTSENDVHDMADHHNAKLRQKHGLPTAGLRPRLQQVALTPYVDTDGGGLAIGGRF